MTRKEYEAFSLPKELVAEIDEVIERGYRGYKSRAEFVKDAVRKLLDELRKSEETQFGYLRHLNPEDDYPADSVKIEDLKMKRIAEIYFPQNRAYCTLCESYKCSHIFFMWSLPKVAKRLEEKGVKRPSW